MRSLDTDENPFDFLKRPTIDAHRLPDAQEWPRLCGKTGPDNRLQGGDFVWVDGGWVFARSNDLYDTQYGQNRHSNSRIQTAEHVTLKKRFPDLFDSIRPTPPGAVQRQKILNFFALERN
jgi:hypothetical protein